MASSGNGPRHSTLLIALLLLPLSWATATGHLVPFAPATPHSGSAAFSELGGQVGASTFEVSRSQASPCGYDHCLVVTLGTSTSVGGFTSTTNFDTGTVGDADQVFFQVCDFALDHTANITIADPNATLDSLANPVFSHSVPLVFSPSSGCPGGTSFDSTLAPELYYTLPRSLVQGGTWTFNVTAGANGWSMDQVDFHVTTYYVALTQDESAHLPLDRATVFYEILSDVTQGPLSGKLTFAVNGLYVNSTNPYRVAPVPSLVPPTSGSQGSVSFLVPSSAQPGTPLEVQLWANLTASGRTTSASSAVYFTIAQVLGPSLCAATTTDGGPTPCPSPLSFPAGSELVVREVAEMGTLAGGVLGAIPGATFNIELLSAGLPLKAPSSFPTQVSADSSGTAREVLDTTLLRASSITLNVTVTDPNDPSLTNHSSLTITLLANSSQVAVVISLNSTQYYGGDTLGGSYQLVLPGGSGGLPAYWTAYAYQVYFVAGSTTCPGLPTGTLEVQGNLSLASGDLPGYPLAVSMSGIVEVIVYAHNGTSATSLGIFSAACALVSPPQLLVNPSEVNYLPGDTISVSVQGVGSIFASGTTYYGNVVGFATVTSHDPCSGSTMQVLFGGTVSGGSFSFTVPKSGASVCYEVSVSAETTSGFVSGQDVEIDEVSGFSLSAAVATLSSYTDGSFQPGQTISLSYALTALGTSSLPQNVVLTVQMGQSPSTRTQQASTSGSVSVTIASGQGAGLLVIMVTAQFQDPSVAGGVDSVSAVTGVMVEPSPSWLGEELGAGSGFTYGDLLLVIALVLVVAVGLFLWWRGRWESPRSRYHFDSNPRPSSSESTIAPSVTEGESAPSSGSLPPPPTSDDIPDVPAPGPDPSGPVFPGPPPLPPPVLPGPPGSTP